MGWVFVHRFGEAKSIYAHLQEPAPAGYYNQGDVIGICGSSGAWSTGPHVHFEHWSNLIDSNERVQANL